MATILEYPINATPLTGYCRNPQCRRRLTNSRNQIYCDHCARGGRTAHRSVEARAIGTTLPTPQASNTPMLSNKDTRRTTLLAIISKLTNSAPDQFLGEVSIMRTPKANTARQLYLLLAQELLNESDETIAEYLGYARTNMVNTLTARIRIRIAADSACRTLYNTIKEQWYAPRPTT